MRFLKRINDRGTVTLPSELREALDIESGDIVEFEILGVVRRKDGDRKTTHVYEPHPSIGGLDQ